MSQVTFKDIYKTEVTVDHSRSGYIRIDLKGKTIPTKVDEASGIEMGPCISMNANQAQILVAALTDLLESEA